MKALEIAIAGRFVWGKKIATTVPGRTMAKITGIARVTPATTRAFFRRSRAESFFKAASWLYAARLIAGCPRARASRLTSHASSNPGARRSRPQVLSFRR